MPMQFIVNQALPVQRKKSKPTYRGTMEYDTIKKIIRLRNRGKTFVEIAREVGHSPSGVRRAYMRWEK